MHRIWRRHSLGLTVLFVILLWILLYCCSDPNSHEGAFYGNAIADWLGTFIILMVTKYLHERGSSESRPFADRAKTPFQKFLVEHSLSLFLGFLCIMTAIIFARMSPTDKWGTVAGNILSQFVQLLALVLLTKRLFEQGSKESEG